MVKKHKCLLNKGHEVIVEPASKRAFSDIEFEKEGAKINSDLSGCDVILGVKQIPIGLNSNENCSQISNNFLTK